MAILYLVLQFLYHSSIHYNSSLYCVVMIYFTLHLMTILSLFMLDLMWQAKSHHVELE